MTAFPAGEWEDILFRGALDGILETIGVLSSQIGISEYTC